jgi:hypothetical protein
MSIRLNLANQVGKAAALIGTAAAVGLLLAACHQGPACECPAATPGGGAGGGSPGTVADPGGPDPSGATPTAGVPMPAGKPAPPSPDVPNACGGSYPLGIPPGWACGTANQGRTVCAGPNATICHDPDAFVLCHVDAGGTPAVVTVAAGDLPAQLEHGDYFGPCLDAQPRPLGEDVVPTAAVDRIRRNACGGTHRLDHEPGHSCGTAGLGSWVCDGPDDVACREPAQVTLCHRPPGNPGNAHTLTVGLSAVGAHLAHGDYLGECRRDPERGDDDHSRGRGHGHR